MRERLKERESTSEKVKLYEKNESTDRLSICIARVSVLRIRVNYINQRGGVLVFERMQEKKKNQ